MTLFFFGGGGGCAVVPLSGETRFYFEFYTLWFTWGVFFKFIYTVVCMKIPAIKTPLLLDTLWIKFVRLAAGRWFSRYTPPIKQDSHDIVEI